MKIDILTLFPEMFTGVFDHSIIGRARAAGLIDLRLVQWRDYALDKHHVVDDSPYGGGAGMVLKCEPLFRAMEDIKPEGSKPPETQVIYMSPQGKPFTQEMACELARDAKHLIFVCGHYEGVDERARVALFDREISIGDYVLTGGELPAAVVIDALVRFLPGVLGNQDSAAHDSFMRGIFDYPHYTRPENFRDMMVPPVLLSGHFAKIEAWRHREALRRTLEVRPEILNKLDLSRDDRAILEEFKQEMSEKEGQGDSPAEDIVE